MHQHRLHKFALAPPIGCSLGATPKSCRISAPNSQTRTPVFISNIAEREILSPTLQIRQSRSPSPPKIDDSKGNPPGAAKASLSTPPIDVTENKRSYIIPFPVINKTPIAVAQTKGGSRDEETTEQTHSPSVGSSDQLAAYHRRVSRITASLMESIMSEESIKKGPSIGLPSRKKTVLSSTYIEALKKIQSLSRVDRDNTKLSLNEELDKDEVVSTEQVAEHSLGHHGISDGNGVFNSEQEMPAPDMLKVSTNPSEGHTQRQDTRFRKTDVSKRTDSRSWIATLRKEEHEHECAWKRRVLEDLVSRKEVVGYSSLVGITITIHYDGREDVVIKNDLRDGSISSQTYADDS